MKQAIEEALNKKRQEDLKRGLLKLKLGREPSKKELRDFEPGQKLTTQQN